MPNRLKNFRTKYPQYNDVNDKDIVNMLAAKFPEAYGDLPAAYTSAAEPAIPPPRVTSEEAKAPGALDTALNIAKGYPVVETGLQALTGVVATPLAGLTGLATLATGQGLSRAGSEIERVQDLFTYKPVTEGGKQLSEAAAYPFTKLQEAATTLADPVAEEGHPNLAAGIKSAVEAVPVLFGAKAGARPAVAGIKTVGAKVGSTVSKLQEIAAETKLKKLPLKTKKIVIKAINTAIKPSATKKKSVSQVNAYDNKALTAVEEIIKNKEGLGLLDEAGIVSKRLPQSIEDFQTAIAKTKAKIFKEYDALAAASDQFVTKRPSVYPINKYAKKDYGKKVKVSLDSSIKELDVITDNKVLKDFSPETLNYAFKSKEALIKREHPSGVRQRITGDAPGYTAMEAQEAVQLLNKSLDAFYASPSVATYGRSLVDSVIANNLRKSLDTTIRKTTGKDYQAIKKKYGALKAIEDDVARAANRVRNKTTGVLLPDFTDVIAGHQVLSGLASFNPGKVAGGLGIETLSLIRKKMKDPDRKIRKMFKTAEENIIKQQIGGR